MSESVNVWREAVCEDRTLGLEKLQDVCNRVQDVMKVINNVSEQLIAIDGDIKRKMTLTVYLQAVLLLDSRYFIPQSRTRDPIDCVSYLAFRHLK